VKTNRTRSTPRKEPTERAPGIDAGPNARGGDATGLMPVVAALAKLNDGQLCALIDATNDVPQIVPGLLAWIGHACDWELNRRACIDFPLQSPDAAIPPEEGSASIAAAMTLRTRFYQDAGRDTYAVVALFDAMIRALTSGARRH
jgi:hypothetical protein